MNTGDPRDACAHFFFRHLLVIIQSPGKGYKYSEALMRLPLAKFSYAFRSSPVQVNARIIMSPELHEQCEMLQKDTVSIMN